MPYRFPAIESNTPTMGLYLHIPFCVKKCDYCDFYSLSCSDSEKARYHEAILDRIAHSAPKAQGRVVDTVYIGGGTPSFYPPQKLAQLLDQIRANYSLEPDCEITAECNPDTVTPALLHTWKLAGINRLSMGVQSANDDELKAVGRVHDFAAAKQAFQLARQAGFDNISLDLIYGLPGQTMDSWQRSVRALLDLGPEHLSCYGLKVEEGTPLWRRRDTLTLADDDLQADMYLWLVEELERSGYGQYEISNFAKPNRHSHHNMRYWLGEEYLGFGPGAHSYVNSVRYETLADLKRFCAGETQLHPEEKPINAQEKVREYVLLRMRTVYGMERVDYESRHNISFDPLERQLRLFEQYSWSVCRNGRWHFTPEGFLRSNALIGLLLDAQEPYL